MKNNVFHPLSQNAILHSWRKQCLAQPGKAAFADGHDARIFDACKMLLEERSLAEALVLLPETHKHMIDHPPIVSLLDRWSSQLKVEIFTALEGQTPLQKAAERLQRGAVDSVLAGNVSTTAEVIRAAIRGVGLRSSCRTVSGSFMMVSPQDQVLLFADAGVVIEPTVQQLVEIASSSVDTWRALVPQIPPRVAFLSFSTKGSAVHPHAEKIRQAADIFKQRFPDVVSDGELQFDAAYVPEVARTKCPESPLKGEANCLVFPDLQAGNIGYKLVQRLGGYAAYGPILQGLAKPYSDLSRGASVADIVSSTYINQVRAGLGLGGRS